MGVFKKIRDGYRIILWLLIAVLSVLFVNVCLIYLMYKSICEELDGFDTINKICESIEKVLGKANIKPIIMFINVVTMMRKESRAGGRRWLDIVFTLSFLAIGLGLSTYVYIEYVRNQNRDDTTKYVTIGVLGVFATLFSILFIIALISSITLKIKKFKFLELEEWVHQSVMPYIKYHTFSLISFLFIVFWLFVPHFLDWITPFWVFKQIVHYCKWIGFWLTLTITFLLLVCLNFIEPFARFYDNNLKIKVPSLDLSFPDSNKQQSVAKNNKQTGGGARRNKSKRYGSSSKAKGAQRLKQRRRASSR